jgi:hypothetical protein
MPYKKIDHNKTNGIDLVLQIFIFYSTYILCQILHRLTFQNKTTCTAFWQVGSISLVALHVTKHCCFIYWCVAQCWPQRSRVSGWSRWECLCFTEIWAQNSLTKSHSLSAEIWAGSSVFHALLTEFAQASAGKKQVAARLHCPPKYFSVLLWLTYISIIHGGS